MNDVLLRWGCVESGSMALGPSGQGAFMPQIVPYCAVNGAAPDGLKAMLPFLTQSRHNFFMENQNNLPHESDSEIQQTATDKTECLSTNTTLYWRVFVPIFVTVFLSGLLLTFLLIPEEELYLSFPLLWGRVFLFSILLGWLFLVRRTLWRLKRVDASATHFFVTNYWVTVRYPWSDVEKMEEKRPLGRRVVNLCLRAPGRFGQKISFLPGSRFDAWKKENEGVIVE